MLLHEPILDEPSIRWDCRHYLGDRPCRRNRLCQGCDSYEPYARRVAVVKVGALGDVIRTLCILPGLARRWPDAQVTWVTQPAAKAMIEHHERIDRVVCFDPSANLQLTQERFDAVICLDKEAGPCALANAMQAPVKLGVGLSPAGTPVPMNREAVKYFQLGLSDELKFRGNARSYPQLVYEALGWRYAGEGYELGVLESAASSAGEKLSAGGWRVGEATLGVNVGAGGVFANKMWPAQRVARLLGALHAARPEVQVVLLGGKAEQATMDRLHEQLPWTIHSGSDNDAQSFIALIDRCDAIFCGDTLAMHLAIARRREVVVFFGPTCEQEIDLFGRGEKLIADVGCSPCYKRRCDRGDVCLEAVSIDTALHAIGRSLDRAGCAAGRRVVSLPVLRVA